MFEPLSREKEFICGRLLSGTVVRRRCLSCLCETAADVMESFGKNNPDKKIHTGGSQVISAEDETPR